MSDENIKTENILRILKLLTQDSARLEELLSEFLQQAAIREFDGDKPIGEAEKEALREVLNEKETE